MKIGAAIPQWAYKDKAFIDALIRQVEELGLDAIWIGDHIITPQYDLLRMGSTWYEALTFGAYVAARTQRVAIGFDVLVVPYREPVVTAKALATLDVLSEGRLIIGVGTGYVVGEFEALGVPFKERGARHDEFLRAFREIWTQKEPTFHGRFVRFADVRAGPKPVQKPYPPLWVGGSTGAAIKRAAELGDGWHPVGIGLDALEQGVARLSELAHQFGRTRPLHLSYRAKAARLHDGSASRHRGDEPRRLLDGSVEQVLDDLLQLKRRGCGHAVFGFGTLGPNKEQMVRELELLATRVLPEVRRWG